ncbi:BspA family leucine-rich repeat surface protein [Bifidobacterium adolescentis]|uniref:BspA family leucine-rich repeat surface protein n=1 Tax=Bifidobacterium adolescentis TaxID=1680 RepID=A0AAW5JWM5_BIFAD|nr:BspA family leucine-rich repeat surface protein [Bifidobacterium adolescentis]MCQ4793375.1 BspA family leucine-rich repeat surface protein [Bifidobacterium adolescentis]
MLKRITRKLAILAVLVGLLSGLAPSMLAVRTAHADEASQQETSTALDRSSAPAPKRSEAAKPEPLTSSDLQIRSAVVPSDALASGTAGTCLFYVTSGMRLTVTPADGTSGTLPTGANASDWPWYRYAAYIRSVSFDPGVKTSSTLSHAFASASTTDPEYSQLESVDLANLDMADLESMDSAFANDTRLGSVSFKGALNADGITDWTSVFLQSGIESIDLSDVGDAATAVNGMFSNCADLKTAVIPWAMAHVANADGMFDGCAGLASLDTSAWRFGSMTNASRMFRNCSNLAALDVSGWDVSHVATFESTFDGCAGLMELDTSAWNTANAMHTGYMFRNCSNLTVLDVSAWSMGRVWFANGIARDGYVFTGWDKDVTKPITGDTVYTAQYRPAVYRIRFDGNGSTSGAMADQSFTYGTPQALTAATFQRDGYSLTGWNTRPDGTGKSFTDKQTVADLLTHENAVGTLYAQWTPTPPVITVVFHSNDGGADETVKRVWASNNLDMKAIGLPDGWTKKGFVFHGWNLAADGSGVEYKAGESLYGRMTTATVDLYADWAGLQSTLPQAGGILHAAPVAGLSIMMLGVPLLILARRHRHGHANPPV